MLRCNACIRKTLSIVFDGALGQPYLPSLTAAPLYLPGLTRPLPLRPLWNRKRYRSYATSVRDPFALQKSAEEPYSPTPVRSPVHPLPNSVNSLAGTVEEPEPSIYNRTELEKEYRWLRDPMKLADRVRELLRGGKYFKALALTRMASKDLLCTVSWNHLVDYDMGQGKVGAAIKTYNEVRPPSFSCVVPPSQAAASSYEYSVGSLSADVGGFLVSHR